MKKSLLAIVLAFAAAFSVSAQKHGKDDGDMSLAQKLGTAEAIIENFYVEEVNPDSIVNQAIIAMLKTLDPHSAYSTPEETRELNEPLEGKFSGIGISFNMSTDTVYVIQTIAGGPSEKVGIRPGDRIITADDSIIAGKKLPNSKITKILRGPKDSQVRLGVMRVGEPELIEFLVTRDDIPLNSVDACYMVTPEVGYIRLTRFAENSGDEVAEAIAKLKKKGMKKLIFDLEGNTGGYLNAAYEVASLFLNKGDLVVYTKGRASQPRYYRVETPKPAFDGPVALMVDQYSASSSEIVAGALQDNDRAAVVGRRTFGKGLVQRPFPFPDGSMMRLTIARYYTPAGRCIQKPYDKGHGEEYQLDLLNRYQSGELWSADSIRLDESQRFTTLREGRTVYGGGGIMPDVFVPVDTSYYTPYYRELVAKAVIPQYSLHYIDQNRDKLKKKYKTEDDFFKHYVVAQQDIDNIVARAQEAGIEPDPEQLAISMPVIEAIFKGYVVRDLFENGNYARAVNPLNPVFVKALETLESK